MAHEVELKLEVSSGAARQVFQLPWLRKLATGPVKRQHLASVYFDTQQTTLRDHGLSLRIRRQGKKSLQTIKADAGGTAGAFGRNEWEEEVAGDEPELKYAQGTALEPLAKDLREQSAPRNHAS